MAKLSTAANQKYLTIWGYVADPLIFVVNKEVWNSPVPADQKAVREAAIQAGKENVILARKGLIPTNDTLLKEIKASGVNVSSLTLKEKEAFKKATRSVYDKWAK